MWIASEETEYSIEYKLTNNPLVLSFKTEGEQLLQKVDDHFFKVELSNSTLRYILTVQFNPRLCSKNADGTYNTVLLGKNIILKWIEPVGFFDKGYYLKTLKMDRNESINQAINYLKSQNQSGYIFNEETLCRYKEDEESQDFEQWFESL